MYSLETSKSAQGSLRSVRYNNEEKQELVVKLYSDHWFL